MTKTNQSGGDMDLELERFFEAAREQVFVPDAALLSRIMADAETVAAGREADVRRYVPVRRGFVETLIAAVGGWPSLAGMATATVAGVWLGVAAPTQLATLTGGLITPITAEYELDAMLPGYGTLSAYEELSQ